MGRSSPVCKISGLYFVGYDYPTGRRLKISVLYNTGPRCGRTSYVPLSFNLQALIEYPLLLDPIKLTRKAIENQILILQSWHISDSEINKQ